MLLTIGLIALIQLPTNKFLYPTASPRKALLLHNILGMIETRRMEFATYKARHVRKTFSFII